MKTTKEFFDFLFDDDSEIDEEKVKREREIYEASLVLSEKPLYPARQSSDALESVDEAYYFLVEYAQKTIDKKVVSQYFNFLLLENEPTSGANLISLAFPMAD